MMKKTAYLGFLIAVALMLSYVEALIPLSFGIPGIKLGLPNLVTVLLLYHGKTAIEGARNALIVNLLRIILAGFLFGNLYAILYSLAGAAVSFAAMLLGKRAGCFSVIGVSVLGGVFHNIGQIFVAALVVENFSVAYYTPVLIAAGTATGAALGVVNRELVRYIPEAFWDIS